MIARSPLGVAPAASPRTVEAIVGSTAAMHADAESQAVCRVRRRREASGTLLDPAAPGSEPSAAEHAVLGRLE